MEPLCKQNIPQKIKYGKENGLSFSALGRKNNLDKALFFYFRVQYY